MATRTRAFLVSALLALLVPMPAPVLAALLFDYEDGTLQGWTREPFFGGNLFLDPSGGNPGGFMVATDTVGRGGSLLARAPAPLSGDLSGFAGLQWDEFIYNNGSDTVQGTSVVLRGADGTEYRSERPLGPRAVFIPRFVPFGDETKWTLVSGGASLASVVSDTAALFLSLDTSVRATGRESGIDNVCLVAERGVCTAEQPIGRVPEPPGIALVGIGLLGLTLLRGRRVPTV